MWQKILGFDFLDYELDKWQTAVLKIQVITFLINFNESAAQFQADVLSNEVSHHVTGSENQSANDVWHQERQFRITASKLKVKN